MLWPWGAKRGGSLSSSLRSRSAPFSSFCSVRDPPRDLHEMNPRRPTHRAVSSRRGQALLETAITLPVLIILMLSFLLAMVVAQAYVDLDTATSLAAASAVSAPAGSPALSRDFA